MGVRGLMQFVREAGLVKRETLSNCALVVDAQNVLFSLLYKAVPDSQAEYGGEYPVIANVVKRMVEKFAHWRITPIFVFDGLSTTDEQSWEQVRMRNQKKLDTLVNQNSNCSGLHAVPVMAKVLRAFGAEVIQADESADKTIAQIANELRCPILSADGDFLLFSTEGRVACFNDNRAQYALLNDEIDDRGFPISMWNYEGFLIKYRFDRTQFAIFAAIITSLLQNDDRKDFSQIIADIKSSTLEDLYKKYNKTGATTERINATMQQYALSGNQGITNYFRSESCVLKTFCGLNLPEEYQKRWRRKQFPPYLMNILVTRKVNMVIQQEDVTKPCVFDLSSPIRQVTYAILLRYDWAEGGRAEIVHPSEYTRHGKRYVEMRLKAIFQLQHYGELPSLNQVPKLDVDQRRTILLHTLQFPLNLMTDVPDDIRLFLAAIRFWKLQGAEIQYIRALLVSMIKHRIIDRGAKSGFKFRNGYLENIRIRVGNFRGNISPSPNRRLVQIHPFTLFQAVLLDTNQLNALLLEPFTSPSAEDYFCGTFLFDVLGEVEERAEVVRDWLENQYGGELYHLYRRMEAVVI